LHLIVVLLLLFLSLPVQAKQQYQVEDASKIIVGHINVYPEIDALIHTDRKPRSKKWLYLKPGKVFRYLYSIVLVDGSVVTKIENIPYKDVQDDRPLSESHPNMAIAVTIGQSFGGYVIGAVGVGLSAAHR
jgi:hypothetical protein